MTSQIAQLSSEHTFISDILEFRKERFVETVPIVKTDLQMISNRSTF